MLSKKEWSRRFKIAVKEEIEINRHDLRSHCYFALEQWHMLLTPLEAAEQFVYILTTAIPCELGRIAHEAAQRH